jgi:cephalosporin hydroxylase
MKRLSNEGRTARDGEKLFFETDHTIEHKITITAAPDGFLRRL